MFDLKIILLGQHFLHKSVEHSDIKMCCSSRMKDYENELYTLLFKPKYRPEHDRGM